MINNAMKVCFTNEKNKFIKRLYFFQRNISILQEQKNKFIERLYFFQRSVSILQEQKKNSINVGFICHPKLALERALVYVVRYVITLVT